MSGKTEVPGVNNAVEKLLELEDRMRTDDFGFRDNDVDNIDQVIDALYELERERKKIHEELEKETIQSSILRHQLRVLPGKIREEVMEAVMAARETNASVILKMENELNAMNNSIIALDKAAKEIEQSNAKLQPERELLKQQHQEIISQLNQRMAEKASLQIALNETRDRVRQSNQDIVDLEDGILQLKEDLIQERTEARQEKKRLRKAVMDTTQKTKKQKDQNVTKKEELDIVQEKLMDSEGKLDAVNKSIRRYEASMAKLDGEEKELESKLAEQLMMNDQMRIRGMEIMNKRIKADLDFKSREQELLNTIKQFEEDIITEGARSETLEEEKAKLQIVVQEKEKIMAEDADRVKKLDAILQAAKEELNSKAEEVGAMQTESVAMSEQMETLAESHKAVVAQLSKQIEDYKEQLSKEKKERLEVQAKRESLSKELDDLKMESQVFMTEMTNVVQDGKKKHQELSNEGTMLQKTLKSEEEEILQLQNGLQAAERKYKAMFDDYSRKIDSMEKHFNMMKKQMAQKQKEIDLLQFQLGRVKSTNTLLKDDSRKHSKEDLQDRFTQIHCMTTVTFEELAAIRDEMDKGLEFWKAYRKVSLSDEDNAAVLALEAALEEKKKLQQERDPVFKQLEIHFNQRTEEYDKMKKDIVTMKNKKQGLEEEIKKMTKDREGLKAPQEQMRRELKLKRQQYVDQMHSQGKTTNDMEQNILSAGCKLRIVVEENYKFEESCRKLEEQLADLKMQMAENERIRKRLEEELSTQKEELLKNLEADSLMQEFFASRDKATAEAFGHLLSRTEKRENKIDMITERLKEELAFLAGFLDTISTRRPQGSKQKVRIQEAEGRGKHQSRQDGGSRSRSQSRERSRSRESRHPERDDQQVRQQSLSPKRSPSQNKEPSQLSPLNK